MSIRSLARNLALLLVSLTIGLLMCEGALRLFKPQPIGFDTGAIWEPAPGIGRRSRANLDLIVNTGERDARLRTDGSGHRVGDAPKPAAALSILAVGDSMLEAIQVDYTQTMTARLEQALSGTLGHPVDVVNAGVGGWDPNHYLIATRDELARHRYDLVLVFVYLDNDIIGRRVATFPPAADLVAPVLRPFADPPSRTWRVLQARGRAWLRQHSHLYVFGENLAVLIPARTNNRPHLLSNAMRANAASPAWVTTADALADLQAVASKHGTPVLYVLLPPAHFIDPRFLATLQWALGVAPADLDVAQPAARMTAELRARGLVVADATPSLRQAFEAGTQDLYGQVDTHFAPAGHAVMARFLEPVVRERLTTSEPAR